MVLEKTLESPLDCKDIQPVHPNEFRMNLGHNLVWGNPTSGIHSWIFIGRTDAEAETLILWPPDAKR